MKRNKIVVSQPLEAISEKDSAEEASDHYVVVDGVVEKYTAAERQPLPSDPAINFVNQTVPSGFGVMMGETPRLDQYSMLDYLGKLRSGMKGVNRNEVSGEEFPRVSREAFEELMYMGLVPDNDSVLETLLPKFCKPGSLEWKDYMATRVGKRMERPDGKGDYVVTRAIVPRSVPSKDAAIIAKSTEVVKQYTLIQIFTDEHVRNKYVIPQRLIHDMELLAQKHPADAAATLREFMQSKAPQGVVVKVSAASSSQGASQALYDLGVMAKGCPPVIDMRCDIVGELLFLYSSQGWHVQGPLRYGNAVLDVYKLCQKAGVHETIHCFALETVKLHIDAYVGNDCVCPDIIGHAGEEDQVSSGLSASSLLDASLLPRFEQLSVNVMPVYTAPDGYVVASGVRLEPRGVLINDHVLRIARRPCVDGRELKSSVPIGSDVWAYDCPGVFEPWIFKEPRRGQTVAIMYHDGNAVVLSEPFKIENYDGVSILSRNNKAIGPGMSGGALVSLEDLSLLGVHVGDSLHYLVGTAVTSTMHRDLSEALDQLAGQAQDSRVTSGTIVDGFRRRGLYKQFTATAEAVTPLYLGTDHVGSAVQSSRGALVTSLPSDVYMVGDTPRAFDTSNGLLAIARADVSAGVPMVRQPQRFEEVIVLGKDSTGLYTSEVGRVQSVGTAGKNFMVSDLGPAIYPLAGGVVVSVQDCAVLGMYVRSHVRYDRGTLAMCSALPVAEASLASPREYLSRLFPFLNVALWPEDALVKAFTHSSLVGGDPDLCNLRGARLGDAYLRLKLLESLAASTVCASDWQAYLTRLCSNEYAAEVCATLGLGPYLQTGRGVTLSVGSKPYADLVEALVGLAAENEKPADMEEFLSVMGLVPRPHEFDGPSASYGRTMSSIGEISLESGGVRLSPAGEDVETFES